MLCEKAFTANAAQAEELLKLAEEKQVFIAEAIWTRYLPMSRTIAELVRNGAVGTPYLLSANLGYAITNRERLVRPELAGGLLILSIIMCPPSPDMIPCLSERASIELFNTAILSPG